MNSNIEKSDAELKNQVLAELEYDPRVKVTDIGVLVKDGVITLNGYVTGYGEKWAALRSAKRVVGVRAIADNIEVHVPDSSRRTDADIAAAAASQISSTTTIPAGSTDVTVRDGWITLQGQVEWSYQKNAAENAVHSLVGVKGVTNLITIKPTLAPMEVELAIKGAFERSAVLDAEKIHVETFGNNVILRGKVQNHTELEEAERVAWAGPGVDSVDNQLEVVE